MALVAYSRFKFWWGLSAESGADTIYTASQAVRLGDSAAPGDGIGARRAQLIFSRTTPGTLAEDVAVMHFDFLNFTSGAPDDTWITGDFTTLEAIINTWWTAVKPHVHTTHTFKEIRWYRFGSGVVPPNPPARVTTVNSAGTGTGSPLPPQVACSISLHTGPRKNWGRTYLPGLHTQSTSGSKALLLTTAVDAIAAATNTLVTSAAAADFQLVVHSGTKGALLQVEQIAVDDVMDIIRRRRWEHPTYRKALP